MKYYIAKFLLILLLVFSANSYYSQKPYDIKAVILDDDDSLAFGNVLLLKQSDSSLIKGNYFIDGNLILEDVKSEIAFLKIRVVGYADTLFLVQNDGTNSVDLGRIKLRLINNDLEEVTITANIPLFETDPSGVVKVNVQETMLSSSVSVLEVLSKSPKVLVNGSQVSVIGKGEALLYLDGKSINIERLGTISVSQIKSIEIISNPSAKYDAQGKSVINIITIVNHSEGMNGSLTQNTTMGKFLLSSTSFSFNYKKRKWSFSSDYSASFGKDWFFSNGTRTSGTEDNQTISNYSVEDTKGSTYVSNFRLGVDYRINNESNISLEYSGLYNDYSNAYNSNNEITLPNSDLGLLSAVNDGQTIAKNHSVVLNYNNLLDTLGSSLFIGSQYSFFKLNSNDFIKENITINNTYSSGLRNNQGQNTITIFTPQLDYVKKFKNASAVELGLKYSYSENSGKVDFLTQVNGTELFEVVSELSNNFLYTENIPALYLQYQGSIKRKVRYLIGLRSEYTDAHGVSLVSNTVAIDTSYINFFPNIIANASLSEKWIVGVSYSGRIDRPIYQDLDPFVWYHDSLTSVHGNPNLLPEMTDAFEGALYFGNYNLTVGYSRSENSFRVGAFKGETGENSIVLQQINVEKLYSYFSSLTIPIEHKLWSFYNTFNLTYNEIVDNRPEFSFNKIVPQFYYYGYNGFNFKHGFNLELMGEYEGDYNDGVYQWNSTYSISLGLSKSLFKKSLLFRFVANDVFRTYQMSGSYSVGGTDVVHKTKFNTNFYRISLVWSFGKLHEATYESKPTGEGELERIKQ
jgi:hypothetical protein